MAMRIKIVFLWLCFVSVVWKMWENIPEKYLSIPTSVCTKCARMAILILIFQSYLLPCTEASTVNTMEKQQQRAFVEKRKDSTKERLSVYVTRSALTQEVPAHFWACGPLHHDMLQCDKNADYVSWESLCAKRHKRDVLQPPRKNLCHYYAILL